MVTGVLDLFFAVCCIFYLPNTAVAPEQYLAEIAIINISKI